VAKSIRLALTFQTHSVGAWFESRLMHRLSLQVFRGIISSVSLGHHSDSVVNSTLPSLDPRGYRAWSFFVNKWTHAHVEGLMMCGV
jgi:hypothetical protein